MTDKIVVLVDSRIWLPPDLPKAFVADLKQAFRYANPEYHKKKAMGFNTWGTPSQIMTYDERDSVIGKRLTLPRGGLRKLRGIAQEHGIAVQYADRRVTVPTKFDFYAIDPKDPTLDLRWYQKESVEHALRTQTGVVRAPTGSGKTKSATRFIYESQERTLVIMRDSKLLNQWKREVSASLGLRGYEVGEIGSGKFRFGEKVTLALQQSLYSRRDDLPAILAAEPHGSVVIDEVQQLAARTFVEVIDPFNTKYRIGVSANETRRDKKEFLIYDQVGPVFYEVERKQIEAEGAVLPVEMRVFQTPFQAPWYVAAEPGERDFGRLIEEMTEDEDRNEIILDLVAELVRTGEYPIFIFTHRREHARYLADQKLSVEMGIPTGLLLGGLSDAQRFEEDRLKLESGRLKVAVGTFQSIGVGIDLPAIRAGVVATPISASNPQFFGQVRGRMCRVSKASGKNRASIYYAWDPDVFPDQMRTFRQWGDGVAYIRRGTVWSPTGTRAA